MSDIEALGGMIPEAKDLSGSKDDDGKDENQLSDMYKEPKHLLNNKNIISGLVEDIEARNSPILPQSLTPVQDNQGDCPSMSGSPPPILDHPVLQTIVMMPTMDPTMDGQFTVDAPMTWVGWKWKARDLYSILVVCTCGQAVMESEIL